MNNINKQDFNNIKDNLLKIVNNLYIVINILDKLIDKFEFLKLTDSFVKKYKVGDIIWLEGHYNNIPSGEYKILDLHALLKEDMFFINNADGVEETANQGVLDWNNFYVVQIVPMPSTGYYDFEIVPGVIGRAYVDEGGHIQVYYTGCHKSYWLWTKGYYLLADTTLDAIDACLKRKRNHGIVPVPYAVSGGNFEAPKVTK